MSYFLYNIYEKKGRKMILDIEYTKIINILLQKKIWSHFLKINYKNS